MRLFRQEGMHWRRWIILGMSVAVIAGLGLHFGPPWVRAGEVIAAQRQIVANRVDSLRSKRVLRPVLFEPAEEGNGWGHFVTALAGVSGLRDQDLVGFPSFSGGENLEPDPARIEASIELVRFKIETLKRALRRPWMEPGFDYGNFVGETFPELARAMKTSRILCDAAENAHARDRADEAVDFLVINLGIADRLTVKSHLVQELTAADVRTRSLESLKKILSNHRLGARQLERLARVLDACDPSGGDDAAWMDRQDLAIRLILLSLHDRPAMGSHYEEALQSSIGEYPSRRSMFAECFEAQDRHAAAMKLLAQRRLSERGAAAGELLASDQAPPKLHGVIQDHVGARWHTLTKVVTEYRLARLSVAVAQYHAEKGSYPLSLEDLTPRNIALLPVDAFGARAFNYFTTEGGAMIVSQTQEPEHAGLVGAELGPEADGFPAWRVRRR
jgi:hypothetical protein